MQSVLAVVQEQRRDHRLVPGHLVSLRLDPRGITLEFPAHGSSSMVASQDHAILAIGAHSVIYKASVTSI